MRDYIIAAVRDQPDAQAAANRLTIKAAKAGDKASQQQADAKWHQRTPRRSRTS